ncbi:MAG: pyridoxal-phosphate dependent enzyme [Melioribacteraceae bacterium]|nr:pyridoxal-phosphate dependent enzyme [Melioribacteraceae bacterium]
MSNYRYKCFDCEKIYSKEEVEINLIYLCPDCGEVEKNTPLKGILLIEYDYDDIAKKISREEFLRYPTGKFWVYDFLYPIDFNNERLKKIKNQLDKISLPSNNYLIENYEAKQFAILDDTRNPTLSFKDRASSLVALKAIELGINFVSAASTGNAGSSLAGICARLGLKSIIFVPKKIPEAKRIQIQSYGAELVVVDGDYDLAFDICLEISGRKKWYNRNTAYNPMTIEGKKSAAFDIFISTKGKVPNHIFIPAGDGVIISGLYKGFDELKKLGWIEQLPKLISVQAKGSDAIFRFYNERKFEFKNANTIADSICAGAPRALYLASKAIKESNGDIVLVDDNEILFAQKIISEKFGMLIEPSSATTFAAFQKMKFDNSLLLFTGNGLKDVSSLSFWNKQPEVLSIDKIKEKYF